MQSTTCTKTVSDTDSGTKSFPSGSVDFSSNGPGWFSSPRTTRTPTLFPYTTLFRSSVVYTPTAGTASAHKVTGDYQGTSTHAVSSGFDNVTVNKQTSTAYV